MGEILWEKVIILRPDSVQLDMTQYFSMDIAKSCKAVLFEIVGGKAKVCFADTSNKRAIEQIRLILLNKGLVLDKYLTFETNINNTLEALEGKEGDEIRADLGDITNIVTASSITELKKYIDRSIARKKEENDTIGQLQQQIQQYEQNILHHVYYLLLA